MSLFGENCYAQAPSIAPLKPGYCAPSVGIPASSTPLPTCQSLLVRTVERGLRCDGLGDFNIHSEALDDKIAQDFMAMTTIACLMLVSDFRCWYFLISW